MSNPSLQIDRVKLAVDVQDLKSVQPMPTSALNLVNACQDPSVHTNEIISIIESEPAIAARVLAVANSPLYGYSRQISTIAHAVVILGIRNITRLAVSFAARVMYCGAEQSGDFCQQLYKHSLGCALVARGLTELDTVCDPDQAFLGGLLHDIGKLVLVQLLSNDYVQLSANAGHGELIMLERDILGFSHEDVGEICAQKWGFPIGIRQAIAHHHGCDSRPFTSPLSSVVEAADQVAVCEGIGSIPLDIDLEDVTRNEILANLNPKVRQEVVENAREEFEVLANAS